MAPVGTFPLPLNAIACKNGGKERGYVIVAMFTAGYSERAERLAASCKRFGLPYAIHEVPAVHRSINSGFGNDDLSYTKANFIHYMLATYHKPVFYLDADCEVVAEPELLDRLVESRCDFAIYNWLADGYVDRFYRFELAVVEEPSGKNRFYRFKDAVADTMFSTTQLLCSGLAQFHANTDAARFLLSEWHRTIEAFPGTADDACLTFTFNNLGERAKAMNVQWLPKAYARYSWWIYAKPVINHEDDPQPDSNFKLIDDPAGRKTIYPELTEPRNRTFLFPRDCIIDTERRMLWRVEGNKLIAVGPAHHTFWI